ncbi:MAG: DinB family protein [Runella slithyformis]|nr:MAG: DinB family protein [Runella slithyformis]TAF02060.1 MAG: DinB family protein [Runella slithyformis]TAF24251.1 MAG: DinB family protein [Runella slithyformis]TAF44356.1 MAG: DinB family protein [Runella slithyformis]TAF80750.1 MAG: DinB family protein [Runella slithyformis]
MDTTTIRKGYLNSSRRVAAACVDISQQEATFRPYDQVNSLVWQVGHLVFFRNTVIKLLNPAEKLSSLPNEKELFGNGSQPAEAAAYPVLNDLLLAFETRGQQIAELLENVSPEHLAAESPYKIPSLGSTVGQQVFSFLIHEANHYGEINLLKTLSHRLRAA